jgi:outer membrane protein assembly factor BamB
MADSARSGVAGEALRPPLRAVWVFRTPFPPQPAWPDEARWDAYHKIYDLKHRMGFDRCYHVVAGGGAVYFGSSSSDQVYCLDATSGVKRWSHFAEGPVRLAPVLDGGRVYFGADDGFVYCLEAGDGSLLWRRRVGPRDHRLPGNERIISAWPVRGGLAVRDGKVYGAAGVFPTKGVYVFALDALSGEERWSTPFHDLTVQGYLLASAKRVYAPSGRHNPMVFDAANGRRLRVVSGHGGSYALLSGEQLVFGPGRTGELGLVEGEVSDQLASFQGDHMIVTPEVSYLQAEGELSALDRPRYLSLARARKVPASRRQELAECLEKLGRLRAGDEAARIKAEMAELGAEIERLEAEMRRCVLWRTLSRRSLALILSGDVLYAGGDGAVEARDGKDGRELWSAELVGKVFGLAVAEGRLFVSTGEGAVHAFEPAAESSLRGGSSRP